jgi:Protein of unknown function (DUF4239)
VRGFLNAVPVTVIMIVAVGVAVLAVIVSVRLIRRIVPSTRDGFHAEISAPMLGVVAALFGLILAFVIVIAYQNFLDANSNVSQEADSLASIVRDSAAFPQPGRANVRAAVGDYVRSVVNDEWPRMREGHDSELAKGSLGQIFAAFRTVRPHSVMSNGFYNDSVRQLNTALNARRDRLETATGGLPRDITILILFSSLVIIAYAILVGSPNYWFHVLGPLAIAVVVTISLVVLFDLTYPFSGDVSLKPNDFQNGALAQFFPPTTRH